MDAGKVVDIAKQLLVLLSREAYILKWPLWVTAYVPRRPLHHFCNSGAVADAVSCVIHPGGQKLAGHYTL